MLSQGFSVLFFVFWFFCFCFFRAIVCTVISSANWAGILPPLTELKSKETERTFSTWMHLKVISFRHRDVIPESSVKSSSLDSSINYRFNIISPWSKQFRTIGCWSKHWTMAPLEQTIQERHLLRQTVQNNCPHRQMQISTNYLLRWQILVYPLRCSPLKQVTTDCSW